MTDQQVSLTKPTPLDMQKWQSIISDWEQSNESQKTYCERLDISLNTFTYARSKLSQNNKIPPAFLPVTLVNSKISSSDESIVIENPQGFKLSVSSALSFDRLTKIFKLCGWQNAEVTR